MFMNSSKYMKLRENNSFFSYNITIKHYTISKNGIFAT